MTTTLLRRSTALIAVVAAAAAHLAVATPAHAADEAALSAAPGAAQLPDDVQVAPPVSAPTTAADRAALAESGATFSASAAPTGFAAAVSSPITFQGRGNGHGIGLSQYGAHGQAKAGRSAAQILRHYYKGATLAKRSVGFNPRIGVLLDQSRIQLVPRGGSARIVVDGDRTYTASANQVWEIRILGSSRCRVIRDGVTVADTYGSGTRCVRMDPSSGARVEVRRGSSTYRQYGRSSVVEVFRDKISGDTWKLDAVVELPLEQYLYGLAEMPYSWDLDALKAQAIAGRSYALWRLVSVGANPDRGCKCHLYDSQQDQVYAGWDREQSSQWSRWRTAVDSTKSTVVLAPGQVGTKNDIVQAFYSSSSNGRTEAKHEIWGGSVYPYLVSVKDSWAMAPSTGNPHRRWAADFARSVVESRTGLDRVDGVVVTGRSASGAATEVRFVGVDGGRDRTVTTTGSWVRSAFGLRSTTFTPSSGVNFVDIAGSKHAPNIAWLAAEGITDGCRNNPPKFCPGEAVTRGQMAKFLVEAFDLPPGRKVFSDTRGHTFQAEIAAIARAGITSGCNPGGTKFCPNAPIRRDQMATFLAEAAGLKGVTPTRFRDARGNRHEPAIEAIRRAGITSGCTSAGTHYCPGDDVKRAQMATFLREAVSG